MRTRSHPAAALLLGSLAACGAPRVQARGGDDAVLAITGRIAGGPLRFTETDLGALPRREFRARDPRTGQEAQFGGVLLGKLLGETVEVQRGADVAVFHGNDGYQIAIPIGVLRQHRPVLADRVDGVAVAQARPGSGPLVLAWPNSEQPGLQHDPRARSWWVDGIRRVEITSWSVSYGKALRVPSGSPDQARVGAEAFASSCMPCHRVRGAGGSRGRELTAALSDADARSRFAASIRAHGAQRRGTVNGVVADLPSGTVNDIATFLRVVAAAGPQFAPEDGPEPPPELPEPTPFPRYH